MTTSPISYGFHKRRKRLPRYIPHEDLAEVQSRTLMNPREVEMLYARFRHVAPYGQMGFSQFCSMLGVLAMLEETQIADRLFRAFDRDHNEVLNFTEFAVALGTMMCGREDDKLDLAFRILNPTFTGTGTSLSDYEFDESDVDDDELSVSSSMGFAQFKEEDENQRSYASYPNDFPAVAVAEESDTVSLLQLELQHYQVQHQHLQVQQVQQLQQAQQQEKQQEQQEQQQQQVPQQQLQQQVPQLQLQQQVQQEQVLQQEEVQQQQQVQQRFVHQVPSHRRKRVSLTSFEKLKKIVYADSVCADDFVRLVRAVEASRKSLLGDDRRPISQAEIENVFLPLTTLLPDGSRRMLQRDFKRAARNSSSFLSLLGIDVGGSAADTTAGGQTAKAWDDPTDPERLKIDGITRSVRGEAGRIYRSVSWSAAVDKKMTVSAKQQQQLVLQQLAQCIVNLGHIEKQIMSLKFSAAIVGDPAAAADSETYRNGDNGRYRQGTDCSATAAAQGTATPGGTQAKQTPTEAAAQAALAAIKETEQQLLHLLEATNSQRVDPRASRPASRITDTPSSPESKLHSVLWPASDMTRRRWSMRNDAARPKMYINKPVVNRRRAVSPRKSIMSGENDSRDYNNAVESSSKGVAIYFGHHSWNTAINFMLGMRLAAGRTAIAPERSLKLYDFDLKEKFSLFSNTSAQKDSKRPHQTVRFTDYAPMVFRRLREMFKIDKMAYIHSIGPEQVISNLLLGSLASLSELVSEGRSGALFYYTADGKFIIKTVSRDAAQGLRKLLPDYFEHFAKHPESLITRFLGLHAIKYFYQHRGKLNTVTNRLRHKQYFLVMENLFHTPVPIHRRYDLKGSTYKRYLATEYRTDPTIALKDNDLESQGEKIDIGPERAKRLLNLLQADTRFLKMHGLMDYSFLVGIYYAPKGMTMDQINHASDPLLLQKPTTGDSVAIRSELTKDSPFSYTSQEPFWRCELGGLASEDGTKLFYFGLIDILTKWGTFKRTENVFRSIQTCDGAGISCVNPNFYASRFMSFLERYIV